MSTILAAFFFCTSVLGWLMFVLEVRLSKKKDHLICAFKGECAASDACIKALRTQNARLMQSVALLRQTQRIIDFDPRKEKE